MADEMEEWVNDSNEALEMTMGACQTDILADFSPGTGRC